MLGEESADTSIATASDQDHRPTDGRLYSLVHVEMRLRSWKFGIYMVPRVPDTTCVNWTGFLSLIHTLDSAWPLSTMRLVGLSLRFDSIQGNQAQTGSLK